MAKAPTTIAVAFAGRFVPAWIITRPDGETPGRCLAWSGGWVAFGAHVTTNCEETAESLRKIGYLSVKLKQRKRRKAK